MATDAELWTRLAEDIERLGMLPYNALGLCRCLEWLYMSGAADEQQHSRMSTQLYCTFGYLQAYSHNSFFWPFHDIHSRLVACRTLAQLSASTGELP